MQRLLLQKVEQRLRGLNVTRAARTYGSMFKLELGDLVCEAGPRLQYLRGRYGLLVKFASWRVSRFDRELVTDASRTASIGVAIALLESRRIAHVRLSGTVSELLFTEGFRMEIHRPLLWYGPATGYCDWSIFLPSGRVVTASRGRLYEESGSSGAPTYHVSCSVKSR